MLVEVGLWLSNKHGTQLTGAVFLDSMMDLQLLIAYHVQSATKRGTQCRMAITNIPLLANHKNVWLLDS